MHLTKNTPEISDWLDLSGRVCVITGGGSGIGEGTARHFAALGAVVAVLDRNLQNASAVAASIEQGGGRAIAIEVDVSNEDAVAAAAHRVLSELGSCEVLVNNAAVRQPGAIITLGLKEWNRLLSVNLTGALICSQVFGQQMIEAGQGGSIVNVASVMGSNPSLNNGVYSVGKAGLKMLSRVLSLELSEHGIRSNVVSPGFVRTAGNEGIYEDPAVVLAREQLVPAARIGTPQDMAQVIAFLASDRASYVTGQELIVDGGLSQTFMSRIPKGVRK